MDTELAKQGDELAVRASGLVVVDQATADKADLLISLGKGMIKKIKDYFRPLKQAQDESKRALLRAEELEIIKIEPVVDRLGQSLGSWQLEERRKAREAEEKRLADERRRRELEDEAMRQAQAAATAAQEEKDRAEAEARRKEDQARREAELAVNEEAKKKADEDGRKAREEAEQKKQAADKKAREEQDRILAAAAAEEKKLGPSPAVAPAARPMAHSYSRTVWKWRVQQPAEVPRDMCKPDDALIDRAVNRAKGQGLKPSEVRIPGVDVWEEIENVRKRS